MVVAVNFDGEKLDPDFIFISNVMKDLGSFDFVLDFAGLASSEEQVFDNSGLMALNMLVKAGVSHIFAAGMDGYSTLNTTDYYDGEVDGETTQIADEKNSLISREIKKISGLIPLTFITPTYYSV